VANTTASNYYNNINTSFPIAGQDNNSQGFRNNFNNIFNSLEIIDSTVADLLTGTVRKTDSVSDFNNNEIKNAVFVGCSNLVYDNATGQIISGPVVIDYNNGSYQKWALDASSHNVSVINWPGNATSPRTAEVTLYVTATNQTTVIDFPGYINQGPSSLPATISGQAQIFKIWNDGVTTYVKTLSEFTATNSSINLSGAVITATDQLVTMNELMIGPNTYSVTNTSTFDTVVNEGDQYGTLAVLPNQISVNTTGAITGNVQNTTATQLGVTSAAGIQMGATFTVPTTPTILTVTAVDYIANTVTSDKSFPVGIGTGVITFKNPQFSGIPTVLTFGGYATTSTLAQPGDVKGQIYANGNSLWVSYADYAPGVNNKFILGQGGIAFSYYMTATNTQSVAYNVVTPIHLDSMLFDSGVNTFNTSTYKFQPTQAGYYQLNVNATFTGTNTTGVFATGFQLNGTELLGWTDVENTSGNLGRITPGSSTIVYLNGTTDYVQPIVYQNVSVSTPIQLSPFQIGAVSFSGAIVGGTTIVGTSGAYSGGGGGGIVGSTGYFSDSTDSSSVQTGALQVAGGVGIVKSVTVGGALTVGAPAGVQHDPSLIVNGNTSVTGNLNVAGTISGFANSLQTNGYQKLPGGLILQWGQSDSVAGDTTVSVTFPISFPSACLNITATTVNTSGPNGAPPDATYSYTTDIFAQIVSTSLTGATFLNNYAYHSNNGSNPINWFAIGY